MIKLEIVDPQLLDQATLVSTAAYLMRLAGHDIALAPDVIPPADVKSPMMPNGVNSPGSMVMEPPHIDTRITHANHVLNPETPIVDETFNPFASPDSNITITETGEVEISEDFLPSGIMGTDIELDSQGIPWDRRIHSRAKSKIANGEWRLARGVSDALVDSVTAELKNLMSMPAPPAAAVPIVPPPPPPIAKPAAVPPPPASVAPNVPVPPPPAPVVETFSSIVQKIQKAITLGNLTKPEMVDILQANGIGSLPLLQARPDLIPVIGAKFDAKIAERAA